MRLHGTLQREKALSFAGKGYSHCQSSGFVSGKPKSREGRALRTEKFLNSPRSRNELKQQ
jgi:hypothetical protein